MILSFSVQKKSSKIPPSTKKGCFLFMELRLTPKWQQQSTNNNFILIWGWCQEGVGSKRVGSGSKLLGSTGVLWESQNTNSPFRRPHWSMGGTLFFEACEAVFYSGTGLLLGTLDFSRRFGFPLQNEWHLSSNMECPEFDLVFLVKTPKNKVFPPSKNLDFFPALPPMAPHRTTFFWGSWHELQFFNYFPEKFPGNLHKKFSTMLRVIQGGS